MDAIFVPWLWADFNMERGRQLFPLGSAKSEVRLTHSSSREAFISVVAHLYPQSQKADAQAIDDMLLLPDYQGDEGMVWAGAMGCTSPADTPVL
ncbi:hypothetical protein [Rhizobium rhizophilum]|uniref:Uncharacterized protein n=1 Tax=Rhizobium rhizophilum TaxID=1850373 RepID=A0ABY2QZA4_9HYPH|nr:hypothetical protein [Rhizobium rhizophilum]THV16763.1 hypothetical protein E9677_01815 [Rhizobium rhizophilum]